jgi:preprotein translocase subunit SecG
MSSFMVVLTGFLYGLHVLVCVVMILAILLQAGKSAGIGAGLGGGGSQTLFGAGGGQNFLTRFTTAAAIIFMLTSIGLAKLSTRVDTDFEDKIAERQKQAQGAAGTEVQPEEYGQSVLPMPEDLEAEAGDEGEEPAGGEGEEAAAGEEPVEAEEPAGDEEPAADDTPSE